MSLRNTLPLKRFWREVRSAQRRKLELLYAESQFVDEKRSEPVLDDAPNPRFMPGYVRTLIRHSGANRKSRRWMKKLMRSA